MQRRGERSRQTQRGVGLPGHPSSAIFENLKSSSLDEILEYFPVSRVQVQAVLDFAAKSGEASLDPPRAA
jgi:hypothetical protein